MIKGATSPELLVALVALQPKKVGRWLKPLLMKVLVSGTAGKAVPLAIPVEFKVRS